MLCTSYPTITFDGFSGFFSSFWLWSQSVLLVGWDCYVYFSLRKGSLSVGGGGGVEKKDFVD